MIVFAVFQNLTLFSVGIAIAATGILGVAVYLNNRKSATGQAFLLLTILTILYGVVNYLNDQFTTPDVILWLLRFTLFFSVLHAFSFFRLFYVFPNEKAEFPKSWGWLLIVAVIAVAALTLTPLVFSRISMVAPIGQVTNPDRGPGIAIFGIAVILLIGSGLFLLVKKSFAASGVERQQFRFVMIGSAITFSSLILFNYILPVYLNQLNLIPLAPIYFFPFVAFTTYAIFKHHLLSVKVISTEILTFLLLVVTFSEIIISQGLAQILFRVGEFILVSIIGTFLIKSVLNEVEQREELERLNQQIAAQNTQLQDLSRFKSQLLSLASHQIKSPLAAIKGFASLVSDGSYGQISDDVKNTMGKIERQADDLLGLINTLLDVRKVEEGKMEYKFEEVDLVAIASNIVESLQPLADAKKLSFSLDAEKKPVLISADPEKFKQVIQNLADNAIKYTPSGFVKISINETLGADGKCCANVSVSDSGLGVAADLIPHLFEEFVRDERVKKEIRGTGLGLYIARKIVEAHGGTIQAVSPGEGKGSTFTVSVPLVVK